MPAKQSKQSRNAKMEAASVSPDSLVISYLVLRKAVGIVGILLPFVVSLGGFILFSKGIQSSISSYYYTGMRDVFVGSLWTIGFFLYSYKGYDDIDNIVSNLACVFAVGVSLFPTTPDDPASLAVRIVGDVHLLFASSFFLALTYFSLFLFTRTDSNRHPTREKRKRNIVYKTCAYVMFGCILLMGIYHFLPNSATSGLDFYKPVYWLESLAIVTFGISWFTKGGAILADK